MSWSGLRAWMRAIKGGTDRLASGYALSQNKPAFTLVEVLVSIAIMGLLTGLLVTNVGRTLSKNRISEDVSLLSAKIEEVRLLAGSTQQPGSKPGSQIDTNSGYYAIFFPPLSGHSSYGVVRISRELNDNSAECRPGNIYNNALDAYNKNCLVEEVRLSNGVKLQNPDGLNNRLIAFTIPNQQLTGITRTNQIYSAGEPVFPTPFVKLTFQDKTATVSIADFTAKLTVNY